jgi:hypothetical protein
MNPGVFVGIGGTVMAVLFLLLWAGLRGKPREDPATGTVVFRYNVFVRVLSIVLAFGPPIAITLLVLFAKPVQNEDDLWAVVFLYVLFAFLGIPLLWETVRYSLAISPAGLACRSPWRGNLFIPWDEVSQLSYSGTNAWFVIHATTGQRFRVHLFVAGVGRFLELVEQHLPPESLEQARPGYNLVRRAFPRNPETHPPRRLGDDWSGHWSRGQ